MEITLRKGMGNPILNVVRSAAFFCCPVVRPIAFKVGGTSNVLSISDTVVEDMTTFISTVSQFDYAYNGNVKIIKAGCECSGELSLSALLSETGISSNRDGVILHSTAPIKVEVIFAFVAGNFTADENAKMIHEAGYTDFVPVNSRHCNVESFTFKHVAEDKQTETFDVSVKTVDGSTESAILREAMSLAIDDIRKLQSHLG